MLVLTRKIGESIAIDDHIKIRVVQIKGKQVPTLVERARDDYEPPQLSDLGQKLLGLQEW